MGVLVREYVGIDWFEKLPCLASYRPRTQNAKASILKFKLTNPKDLLKF